MHRHRPSRSATIPALQTRRIDHPDRDLYSKQNKQAIMLTYIPTDLLCEIFSRLPVKSLLRFRCVSSPCRSIIDDPYLAYMHQTRSSEEPNVLVFHNPQDRTEIMFRGEGRLNITKASLSRVSNFDTLKDNDLQCSCNGLSCFAKRVFDRSDPLFLVNPLRNQVLSLLPTSAVYPSQGPEYYGIDCEVFYGLGFDCSKNTYKIVRVLDIEKSNGDYVVHGEVFTLGTSSWRVIPKGPSCSLYGLPVFACGNIHWLGDGDGDGDEDEDEDEDEVLSKIVSFDISKEEFGLISTPEVRLPCHLLDLNGNLAIVNKSIWPHIDIWVLKDYERKDQWIKQYDIVLKPPLNYFLKNIYVQVLGLVESGGILILRYVKYLFSCDVRNGELRYVLNCDQTDVLCNKGSLLSISGFHAN